MKILLPTIVPEQPALDDLPAVRTVAYDPRVPVPDEHLDADGLVCWGNTPEQLADSARRLRSLRWVQDLKAGADIVLSVGFSPAATICSGRGLHDGPVAEHTLGMILAAARRLDLMAAAHRDHRWADELGGLQAPGTFPGLASLDARRVTIWGFGSIGQTLAPHLSALGATVTGVARSAGDRGGYPVVADADLVKVLPETDLLVAILPATSDTHHAVNAEVLAALPPHAWVVNVGRGVTLDETALAHSLAAGEVGGAALDVFETEPLPADSPLWTTPNTIITPHAAGGRPRGVGKLLTDNIAALVHGLALRNVVRAGAAAR